MSHCVQVQQIEAQILGEQPLQWEVPAGLHHSKLGSLCPVILEMLSRNPKQRPTLAQIHRRFKSALNALSKPSSA
jgi:hypothetical protein